MKKPSFLLPLLMAMFGFTSAADNAGHAAEVGKKEDGLAVEKDGVVFEIVLPERIWSIPENKPGGSSRIELGLKITNKSEKPLRFNSYDAILPEIQTPDSKDAHQWAGPLATERHRLPTDADFPLVMPGKSVTFSIRADLFWPTMEQRTLMFRSWHASGSPARYFDQLKPGAYRVRIAYENNGRSFDIEKPEHKVLDGIWTGRIVTPSVQVSLSEPGKDGPSTRGSPPRSTH